MNSRFGIVLLFVFPVLFLSCAVPGNKASEIIPDITSDEVNTRIKLVNIEDADDLKIGETIHVDLVNVSRSPIGFPSDYGIRVYTSQDNQWIRAENNFGYPPLTHIVVPQEVDPLGDAVVPFHPSINNSGESVVIRVIVVGTLYENDKPTLTKTAAYIDLTLRP